jgi:hypothetical protein
MILDKDIEIKPSLIENTGHGVFAKVDIPAIIIKVKLLI